MAKHDIYNKDAEVQTNLNMFGIVYLNVEIYSCRSTDLFTVAVLREIKMLIEHYTFC